MRYTLRDQVDLRGRLLHIVVCVFMFSNRLVALQWHSDIPQLLGLKSLFGCNRETGHG